MQRTRKFQTIAALLCAAGIMSGGPAISVQAAGQFDPNYYAAAYPDVAAVFGTDSQALLKHYQDYGMKEGRLPYEGAEPGASVEGMENAVPTLAGAEFDPAFYAAAYPDVAAALGTNPGTLLKHYQDYGMKEGRLPYEGATPGVAVEGTAAAAITEEAPGLVPLDKLVNLSSLRKKATDAELAEAYNVAAQIVTPYIGCSRRDQLLGIAAGLRDLFDNEIVYSTSAPHYNDPYGYFVLHAASCAGCARATGMCLNMLGIPYEHVNPNQWTHQWCRINVDGEYWICDAYGLYCGPEPAPYTHPYF